MSDGVKSGDETDHPLSAISTERSLASDEEHEPKRKVEEDDGAAARLESIAETANAGQPLDDTERKPKKHKRNPVAPRAGHESSERADLESGDDTPEDVAKQYKKFVNAPKYNLNSEEVYCVCRRPDHEGLLMISCDGCDEWFHFQCMKMNPQYQKLIAKFYCKFCQWKQVGHTEYKRKCRVSACLEPIAAEGNSKYCSQACGLEFMRTRFASRKQTDLTLPQIKSILIHASAGEDAYQRFVALGSTFPQLSASDGAYPESVQSQLALVDRQRAELAEQTALFELKLAYLAKFRDKIKVINDHLDTKTEPTKKGGKAKRLDICGYSKQFSEPWSEFYGRCKPQVTRLLESSNIYADFEAEVNEITTFFHSEDHDETFKDLCVNEKRKCLRHGGWTGLVQDEISQRILECGSAMADLEKKRLSILRDYAVLIFEGAADIEHS